MIRGGTGEYVRCIDKSMGFQHSEVLQMFEESIDSVMRAFMRSVDSGIGQSRAKSVARNDADVVGQSHCLLERVRCPVLHPIPEV